MPDVAVRLCAVHSYIQCGLHGENAGVLTLILNSSTGLILSLISNFKIYENIQQYHQLQINQ